ncbi:NAD(P)/FAD-dependent oxidoreductase [Chamaesiphon polymorphus]|uniref:Aminoacetone oxidase family FAD-binding enzyme n=1 Tax=Chamaesiphon polymorphus CCALA 037 TaxID=2107692 RepID=A0A2T1GK90_9CYAN|nr:NAD(P)/FAD-dependent oxidoreductase [Chamaesiphon polymorphus]PSB58249.1 aminoacetone oxidase family FAD-binding enzyme [Chamaesiphon polymorphus CCALA 037]
MQIIIIGGGAAGFFAAITCAQTYPDTRITLIEAGKHPLAKVKISGGGRCNVTHSCFEPTQLVQYYPRGNKALRGAFSRFQPRDTVNWYAERGVNLKTEADGRMFPTTDDSETIVRCLLDAAAAAGVKIWTGEAVAEISPQQPSGWSVTLKSGAILSADRVLLATGSNPSAYKWAQQLGHEIAPPVPSLFTFNIPDPRLAELAGVSVKSATVKLAGAGKNSLTQTGALLITHWGVSGPAALKLSAWGARLLAEARYQTTLIIDWLPEYRPDKLRELILSVKSQLPQKTIYNSCPVPIPHRLWESLTSHIGIQSTDRWAGLANKTLDRLINELNRGEYQITGKGVFKEEFVTCGGVDLKSVNFQTMESKICPGLYFAGEILDIDGVTGGFNFQSAWTTGYLAGLAMGA